MIKQYFKQALAQLRQHPLISVISIAGTALSIFLIMLVVMLQQVKVAPFSPESNRDRFLHVHYMSISHKDWGDGTSNGPMYNPQIQISVVSGTKRSIFRQKNKTKRSKKRLHTTLIKPEQKVNEDLCSGFIVS